MQSDEFEKLGRYEQRVAALKRALGVMERKKGRAKSPWWAVFARMAAAGLWLCGMALHLPGLLLLTLSDELRESVHLSRYRRAMCGGQK